MNRTGDHGTGRLVALGAAAGALAALGFNGLHHLLISDIWATTPFMMAAGAASGASLAWSFALLFPAAGVRGWYAFNAFQVGMLGLLGVASVVVYEPITTVAAVMAEGGSPDHLFARAMPLSVVFALGWAVLLAVPRARTWTARGAALLTAVILTGLLGLNLSIIGLVQIPAGSAYLVLYTFGLSAVLILGFAAILHGLARRRFRRAEADAAATPSPVAPHVPAGLAALATLVAAGLAGGCGGPYGGIPPAAPERAEVPAPIRIGATMSETGTLATQGAAAANGYRLCERDVNAAGGVLGRPVAITILDDRSDPARATRLYERLIVEDGVDLVLGPYGSTHTEAVAPVTERHRQVHVSPLAATSSIWEQGRRYLFMVLPPAELFLAGLIDLAAERGLERVAILQEDALFPRAAGAGAAARAGSHGMEVVLHETYARGATDFSPVLARAAAGGAQVVAMAASSLGDFVLVVRQMRDADVDVAMFGTSGAVAEFGAALGPLAEYTYGLSAWEPGLPYPGAARFVAAYRDAFGREPSFHAAGAYAACQLLAEAARRAGSLDADALRAELLALETTTVFGEYAVDGRGYQTAHRGLLVQWQDGQKAVVWPEELATAAPRFPTPRWRAR